MKEDNDVTKEKNSVMRGYITNKESQGPAKGQKKRGGDSDVTICRK
jgi:hypothetical protein